MENAPLAAFLDRLADAASESIMPHFRASPAIEDKGESHFDPVTVADRAAEAAMRRLIEQTFPEHGVIGEEYGDDRPEAEYVWVLDPIDGTRAFITGLPVWGTLIGLTHEGRAVLGMMAQPFTGERYGGDGRRAWYRGPGGPSDLATRSCTGLADAALFTTSPGIFKPDDRVAYDRVERQVKLARYGCDCYAYCMVASGHADIVIETELHPYDIVALIPIIEGAGGVVSNWEGAAATSGGRIAAVGDKRLQPSVLDTLAGR